MNKKYNIIAETAFTHEGDFEYLKRLICATRDGASDYIKFQVLIDPENYAVKQRVGPTADKTIIFDEQKWTEIVLSAKEAGLKVLMLPLTVRSATFCRNIEEYIDAYEVHSVCFHEKELLNLLSESRKRIFLGIGGRYPHEIYNIINKYFRGKKIVLMHGYQSFPTDESKINLNKVNATKSMFGVDCGYADHTFYDKDFYYLINYAYVLGARYFEKHIILEKGSNRIDHESAITSSSFLRMREELDLLINILGDGQLFNLNHKEISYRRREKKIVSIGDVKEGTKFDPSNVGLRTTDETSDFEQYELSHIMGRKAADDIPSGTPIMYHHLK